MHGSECVVDLLGCSFSGNLATERGGDIFNNWGTVKIDGCPAGFSGAAAGDPLDTDIGVNEDGGTTTGETKSYSCGACVR